MKTVKEKRPEIIGLKDLRENMEDYITKVKSGASFIIARRSQPIFEISPINTAPEENIWETIIDFTEIDKEGVSARDVLRSLKKLHGANR